MPMPYSSYPVTDSCFPVCSQLSKITPLLPGHGSLVPFLVCSPLWSSQEYLMNKTRSQLGLALRKWVRSWWSIHQLSAETLLMLLSSTVDHNWSSFFSHSSTLPWGWMILLHVDPCNKNTIHMIVYKINFPCTWQIA